MNEHASYKKKTLPSQLANHLAILEASTTVVLHLYVYTVFFLHYRSLCRHAVIENGSSVGLHKVLAPFYLIHQH